MPKAKPLQFKKDSYRIARGGRSQFIDLSCDRCGKSIAVYQKDGPGPLKRMYVDRIVGPELLVRSLEKVKTTKKMPMFNCPSCKEELGVPMIYEKEERLAYKLFQSVLVKKKHLASPVKKKK